ncbi:hypothetical protein [Macrococcus capreoli]|uniref:hypothetical protein n=1 Tax=Macrococcus capreoli TaxID=2982690 RepID=UPI0021D605A4|nr:hypothetical protein [Macrococcus sp. TMW 2.2395]MCU7556569.1 hypothetical protein [Macrococcus sp. TMW 2.2395]
MSNYTDNYGIFKLIDGGWALLSTHETLDEALDTAAHLNETNEEMYAVDYIDGAERGVSNDIRSIRSN